MESKGYTMNLIGILQPVTILLSALAGLGLGIFTPLGNISIGFVEVFLILLLYIVFLSINTCELKESTLNIKYTFASICVNFIITPITAYLLGILFFENSIEIRIGLLMLLVTPCTDWYLVFTKLSKGNIEINTAILPINLTLQVILLPVYLFTFLGSSINIDSYAIIKSIMLVLALPCVCAVITRFLIKNNTAIKEFISEKSDTLQLIFLCSAVVIMFAAEGKNLLENYLLLLKLFIPLLCFFVITFFIVKLLGNMLHFKNEDVTSLHITTLARNSPLALAIAVATFPAEPLISLALIIGPLIELPILSVVSGILRRKNIS